MGIARDSLIGKQELLDRIFHRYGLRGVRVHGSVVKGTDGPESDIDLIALCHWKEGSISAPLMAKWQGERDGDLFMKLIFFRMQIMDEMRRALGVKCDLNLIFKGDWVEQPTPTLWRESVPIERFY